MNDEMELKDAVEAVKKVAEQLPHDDPEIEELIYEENPTFSEEQEREMFILASMEDATPPLEQGISLEVIDKAYQFLLTGNNELWKAQLEQADRKDLLAKVKWLLENEKAKALADGRNDGKNEDARKAKARELFPDLYKQVDDLEREIDLADTDEISFYKLKVSNARDNIDRLNMKLRFLELAQLAGAMENAQQEVPITKPHIQVAKKYNH